MFLNLFEKLMLKSKVAFLKAKEHCEETHSKLWVSLEYSLDEKHFMIFDFY